MASGQDESMDFHRAFLAIDTDHSGEITIDELQSYCRKMNYQETFVQKWLLLFDADQNGRITYDEYCNALGLLPKKDVVAKHKAQQGKKGGKTARTVKVAKRRKEQEEVRVTTEALPPATPTQEEQKEELVQAASVAPVSAAATAQLPPTSAPARARVRNQPISSSGLMHFSRARMFQRKALYRLVKKSADVKKSTSSKSTSMTAGAASAKTAQKPIGGEKNGGSRLVPPSRQPRSLPTKAPSRIRRRRPNRSFSQQRRRLRASIKPGVVLILLAGRHRGKRVVFLRQLESGLLLVTGPLRANGCPLRRVCQSHVIATATRIELGDLRLPDRINDLYFRRCRQLAKKQTAEREAADLFARQRAIYELSQERREDQKLVDSQVLSAVRKLGKPENKLMLDYLGSQFSLKSGQKPHELLF